MQIIHSEFGQLKREQDKILIKRIKVIEKKGNSHIKRAEMKRLG